MFEVPLGCPKFGLYADYMVNNIPYGSLAYIYLQLYGFKNFWTGSWSKETYHTLFSDIVYGCYISEKVIFLKSS